MSEENNEISLPEEKSEIELAKEEIESLKNKYLRALADLDNFKKRSAIEQDSLIQFANENLIRELLPALDGFERALTAHKKPKDDEFIKGVALIKRQIEDALKKFGVTETEALGKAYDPNLHEAILTKESDKPENTVIEELQKGYTLKGRLLRPAMVIVSKKGEK